ncbi:MAG TPA: hypothetical protein VF039_11840 [Longimicrobiales bacterium]
MTRRASLAAALGFSLLSVVACGEPIIVSGDQPGVMTIVAGVPNRYGDSLDSMATSTELALPLGLAVGAGGVLYIADGDNARIVAVTSAGGASVRASADGCVDVCLVRPTALAVETDGTLWIADAGAHRIFRLAAGSDALEVMAGTGVEGSDPDGTPGPAARLARPSGIVVDGDGTVYFSEQNGNRVRSFDAAGALLTVAGNGDAGYSEGQPATNAMLDGPAGLALDGVTLYIADERNHRVRTLDLAISRIRTVAGIGVAGFSDTDSLALNARLNRPRAVAVSADGTQLFVAEAGSHIVRIVGLVTGRTARFAGTGDTDFNGQGGDAGATSLDQPSGIAIHDDGMLFISDTGHHLVWRTPGSF